MANAVIQPLFTVHPKSSATHKMVLRFFCIIIGAASVVLPVSLSFAQSPTCDIQLITNTFTGAGYVPLNVQGQPCSMYFVNPNSMPAGNAQAAAAALGANLVWMNDAAENANVVAALNASAYSGATIWIGVQRSGAGANTFFASDGTTGAFVPNNGDPNIYQNWAGGEPNNNGYGDTDWLGGCDYDCQNGEQCVQIYSNGQWNDLSCADNSISVIEVNLCPEITVTASANNVCAGNPVTLTASTLLGSQPYQYAWSTNELTAAITVTPATTTSYDVGVVDRYMCSAQETVTVDILPGADADFDAGPDICIGDPATITYLGSAAANATYNWNFGAGTVLSGSGQGPYQVAWAASGTYNVTLQVTENGCTSPVETHNVVVLPSPVADFTFTTVCQGNPTDFTNTSTITIGSIAGSAWDFGNGVPVLSQDASYTFPSAGTFPVILGVASADGCLAQTTLQVTVNPGPTGTFSSTDVTCYGACDGTATINANGGALPLTYLWSNGANGSNLVGLCPGVYTGTVTDNNGCGFTGDVTVAEPADLVVTVDVVATSCPGLANGTATTNIAGGTPPYNTSWGAVNPNALPTGNYSVTVTDAHSCTVTVDYVVPDGLGLVFNFNIVDNICFAGDDGSATLTVSNGISPYGVVWTDAFNNPISENPASLGVETINGLVAGTYNVVVLDAIGCMNATTIAVTQPNQPLILDLIPQDLNCYHNADGEILVTQNGLAPYQYELTDVYGAAVSNGQSAVPYNFTGLDAGIYFVRVTDANGCETVDAVELFEPAALDIETAVNQVLCYQSSTGSIQVLQISGGTSPYQPVAWDDPNGQVGNTATNLAAGFYTATVTDANGCTLQESFNLIDPPGMVLSPSYLTDTCGQGHGAAVLEVQMGTPPYTFEWRHDGINGSVHYDLYAGSYDVVVTDANGCEDSTTVQVQDDLPYPTSAFEYVLEGENEIDQEVQFINNSIGTTQWIWSFGDGDYSNEEDPRHYFGKAGNYLVQLLASNGYCYDTAYQYVNIDPLLAIYIPNAFTPGLSSSTMDGHNDYFYPQGVGIDEESYDMFIFDRWGKLVWQTGLFQKKWDGRHMESLEVVPVGTYVYQITFREEADLDRHVYNGVVHVIRR